MTLREKPSAAPTELATSFSGLELPEPLRKHIVALGFDKPTPIQAAAYAPASAGQDILALSATGSGKTLAFALPLLTRLMDMPRIQSPRALILTPTRELAEQVSGVLTQLARGSAISVATIIGGGSYRDQKAALRRSEVVIGTPGRMVDLLQQEVLKLDSVNIMVLDEVDQMLDVGFAEALQTLSEALPKERQTLFFSATLAPRTKKLARSLLRNPAELVQQHADSTPDIGHRLLPVRPGEELRTLVNALIQEQPSQAIIFCDTKIQCSELAEDLLRRGFAAGTLNSDLSQTERSATMARFKKNEVRYLVATDVAARGIDVKEMPLVVNMSTPRNREAYVHRTGRTGRAGARGEAWTLVVPMARRWFSELMRAVGSEPEVLELKPRVEILGQVAGRYLSETHNPELVPNELIGIARTLIYKMPAEELAEKLAVIVSQRLAQIGVFDVRPWIERSPEQRAPRDQREFTPRRPGGEKPGWAAPRRGAPGAGNGKPFRPWGAGRSPEAGGAARGPRPEKAAQGRFGRRPGP